MIPTTAERALTLRKSDSLDDWYVIEWAEHENRGWIERTEYGGAFRWSGRVSDADVEGTANEMRAIADAIEAGRSESFRRCAAHVCERGYQLSSPRNSQREALISHEQARHLASEIRRVLAQEF